MANINCPKRYLCDCPDKHMQGRPAEVQGYLIRNHQTKEILHKTACFSEHQKHSTRFNPNNGVETDEGAIECFGYKSLGEVKL